MCDNVDCKNKSKINLLVYMDEAFGGENVVWCLDCIERDSDFVDFNKMVKWIKEE